MTALTGTRPADGADWTSADWESGLGSAELPPRAVRRQRITDELSLQRPWRIALLTGGPAFGKTVAAAQWFAALDDGVIHEWVTLSRRNRDPAQFWSAMDCALERAVNASGNAPRKFAGVMPSDLAKSVSRRMIELSDVGSNIVIVIDDTHHIRSREVWSQLQAMIEQLPTNVRLVLTTRVEPPLPIPLWAARRWLLQIRQSDLSFTLQETAELFDALGQHDLDASTTEEIWRHTEGWIASLHLAAAYIRSCPDPYRAAREFSGRHRMVVDLLVSEVLDPQHEEIREFLLRTSVLETLDPELCDAVSGRGDSGSLLSALETEIPFLMVQETSPRTYRYHPLFLETLQAQLSIERPGARRQMEFLAGRVCEQRGDDLSAVRYWIAAGEHDRAAKSRASAHL